SSVYKRQGEQGVGNLKLRSFSLESLLVSLCKYSVGIILPMEKPALTISELSRKLYLKQQFPRNFPEFREWGIVVNTK
ncbi:hypothetical protein, partial [[Phormidium] sp. LEGE 05292]|uniref:hypothetical protein n=1 Tax=[Phormidium] sp. LEGE 05292 TaxID=767427 RepID=UPI001D13BC9A